MHFMDKEDCFACMDSLIGSKKHSLDKNIADYCITAKTFQDSLKKWKVCKVTPRGGLIEFILINSRQFCPEGDIWVFMGDVLVIHLC